MKKTYINPEMEIVEIHKPMLLAGSMQVYDDVEVESGDIMAPPGMDIGPSIPGIPSFIFK